SSSGVARCTVLCASMIRKSTASTLFPCTTLFRSRSPFGYQPGPQRSGGQHKADSSTSSRPNLPPERRPHQSWRRSGGRFGREERSEEHTSELQSRGHLVCRLLLEEQKPHQAPGAH